MKRYNLVQSAGMLIGQLLPYDSEDKIFMFLKEIINIRKQYNIFKILLIWMKWH